MNKVSYSTSGRYINPVRSLVHSPRFGFFVLLLMHPLLAIAMRSSSLVSTAHAYLVIFIGIGVALGKNVSKAGYVAAYIVGAEVLWRMTDARIFWEGGKYCTILTLGLAYLRMKTRRRSTALIIIYFILLSISALLTIEKLGFSGTAREAISFNLSGPLALLVCVMYFSQITLSVDELRQLLWWAVLPILGVAVLVLSGTLSAQTIVFTDESNFATSGGFGPNQISAILGLGGGLAILFFLTGKGFFSRLFSITLAIGMLSLSALTFSRGGVYNAGLMLLFALVHYLRDKRGRMIFIVGLLVFGILGGYLIFPRLNAFTGGMLETRFGDLDTTLRVQIGQADLELWSNNLVFGVGPGMSSRERLSYTGIAAHTEYTRTLAEHGLFGLLALILLMWMAVRAYFRAPTIETQTWVAALLAWPLMEMTHAAMRLVAISFLFGLAMICWNEDTEVSRSMKDRRLRA